MADQKEFAKPVRPLTAYHLFFQLERAAILQSIDAPNSSDTEVESEHVLGKDIDPAMPARYRNIKISPTWYKSSSGKRTRTKESDQKRKHRKSHGKISFQELSKRVAGKWKTLEQTDNETKLYCSMIAKKELNVYKQKVKLYKASLAAEEKAGVVRSSVNTLDSFTSSVGSSYTTARSYTSSIAPNRSTSPVPSINHLSSSSFTAKSPGVVSATLSEASNFEVSPDFLPTWMATSNLNVAGCKKSYSKSSISKTSPNQATSGAIYKDAGFSFIPIPPSLLDREDSFLQSCKKRARYSPELSKTLPINSLNLHEERNDSALNDVVFDSNMRYLHTPRLSYADRSDEAAKVSRKRSSSDISKADTSPFQLRESLLHLEYNFTEDDAEMLLKALF